MKKILINSNLKISIIGLGYVGLPLAIAFSKKFHVVGYDINKKRIIDLKNGVDKNTENDLMNLIRIGIHGNVVERKRENDLNICNINGQNS